MQTIWSDNCHIQKRPSLQGHLDTDVLIIGAGLTGILTGFLLQKAGKQVVLIEASRIASGQSGHTTAKITAQHGLIYHTLLQRVGLEKTKQYALAQQTAMQEYQALIDEYQIPCDLSAQSSYLYAQSIAPLKQEYAALLQLGFSAELLTELPAALPFSCAGALRMQEQLQYNPLILLKTLSDSLTVYENTPAVSVKDQTVYTPNGTVCAGHIVFACHYPFLNFPGLFFARMFQKRSYVLALENAEFPDGMWIGSLTHDLPSPAGSSSQEYSFRHYGPYLLLGGEGHRTGCSGTTSRYDALRQKARQWFPHSREVAHWSAQDCISIDHIPYIGSFSSRHPHWYAATGFQKWGMTNAMASALILRNQILQIDTPFAPVFDPRRFALRDIPSIAALGGKAAMSITKRIFQLPKGELEKIPPGHGGVILIHGHKVGVYNSPDLEVFTVDIRCPHLGCQLAWNQDELSWDCPCHGSRFDYRGQLLSGPAQKGISI